MYIFHYIDHQKLEREGRICRQLKHPNIGKIVLGFLYEYLR
jgi:hypothetical protein